MTWTPCIYMEWNEIIEKDQPRRPAVDCNRDCDHCGWNPGVAKERLKRMKLARTSSAQQDKS